MTAFKDCGAVVKPFRDIPAGNLKSYSLPDQMASHGYVLIRDLLPSGDLERLLAGIAQIVSEAGWLIPGHDILERVANPSAACGDPDPSFKRVYEQVFSLESFHAMAHHPALRQVMELLVGPRVLVHPKSIGRLIFPKSERFLVHAHQDHRGIGGDAESFTAWMPLHDCPAELGPLQILEASHRFGLQNTGSERGFLPVNMARGSGWVGGPLNAGDVLIFHSLTVHAATPNVSDRVRISLDCRFQDYRRAINPAALVFPGSEAGGRSWIKTYAGWHSGELQYFWKRLPLRFEPSRLELAELAETAEPPEMRARYARILSQLDSQMPR